MRQAHDPKGSELRSALAFGKSMPSVTSAKAYNRDVKAAAEANHGLSGPVRVFMQGGKKCNIIVTDPGPQPTDSVQGSITTDTSSLPMA